MLYLTLLMNWSKIWKSSFCMRDAGSTIDIIVGVWSCYILLCSCYISCLINEGIYCYTFLSQHPTEPYQAPSYSARVNTLTMIDVWLRWVMSNVVLCVDCARHDKTYFYFDKYFLCCVFCLLMELILGEKPVALLGDL